MIGKKITRKKQKQRNGAAGTQGGATRATGDGRATATETEEGRVRKERLDFLDDDLQASGSASGA